MAKHIIDTRSAPSVRRVEAFLRLERAAAKNPSRVPQFRKAGSTIRSMPLRQYLRLARVQMG